MEWYKRDVKRALIGMKALSLEERGAYNTILDLIYYRDNQLKDDDRDISRMMGCDVRKWRRLKERLVDLDKISVIDGCVRNKMADQVLDEFEQRSGKDRYVTIGELEPGFVKDQQLTFLESRTKNLESESNINNPSPLPGDWPSDYLDRFWQLYPRRCGKAAVAAKLVKLRRSGLSFGKLIDGVVRYVNSHPDPKYTKMPITWLNQGCWDDEPSSSRNRPDGGGDVIWREGA